MAARSNMGREKTASALNERAYVEAGGLMSYGVNWPELVDKILRGAKPANIPIKQPTKSELVINLKTAKALGLDMPALEARFRLPSKRPRPFRSCSRRLSSQLNLAWSHRSRNQAATSPVSRHKRLNLVGKRIEILRELLPDLRQL